MLPLASSESGPLEPFPKDESSPLSLANFYPFQPKRERYTGMR